MTNDDKNLNPAINTDQTIYRQPTTDYGPEDGNDKGMEPSVFVTKEGAVGFNHYGKCVVKPIKEWVEMALNTPQQPNNDKDLKCPDYVESAFRKWFEYSPCFICGYKGGGYYQIKDHPCAEHYHNRTLSKLWDMDGNPIQHSLSGVPQQPSEPLKELDEVRAKLKEFYADYESCVTPEERRGCLDHWESEFGQPSEKKVLSVEDMKKIMWDLENKLGYQPAYETIAQAIFDAMPAQREVRYPEYLKCEVYCYTSAGCQCGAYRANQIIDEFKKLNGG